MMIQLQNFSLTSIYEFNNYETAGDIEIELNGTEAGFPDGNAILSGVSLQFIQPLQSGALPMEGLVGLWEFEGNAIDTSGNGHDGTLENGASFSDDVPDGATGQSLSVGGEQHVLVPHSDTLSIANAITMAAWVKPIGDQGWDGILAKNPSDGSDPNHAGNYELRIENGDRFLHFLHQQGEANDTVFHQGLASIITADAWTHIAVTADTASGDVQFYINGELSETLADVIAIDAFPTNGSPLYIGSRADLFTAMDGLLDDVALFNRALSAEEVAQVMAGDFFPGGDGGGGGGDDPLPEFLGSVFISAGGGVSIDIPAGATVDIEYSTDLINWETIATGATGTYEDSDAARAALGAGFYRAK